jgi:hypothetical protein
MRQHGASVSNHCGCKHGNGLVARIQSKSRANASARSKHWVNNASQDSGRRGVPRATQVQRVQRSKASGNGNLTVRVPNSLLEIGSFARDVCDASHLLSCIRLETCDFVLHQQLATLHFRDLEIVYRWVCAGFNYFQIPAPDGAFPARQRCSGHIGRSPQSVRGRRPVRVPKTRGLAS